MAKTTDTGLREKLIEIASIELSIADPDERSIPDITDMADFYRSLATPAIDAILAYITAGGLALLPVERRLRQIARERIIQVIDLEEEASAPLETLEIARNRRDQVLIALGRAYLKENQK